jgi:hypothetical protein
MSMWNVWKVTTDSIACLFVSSRSNTTIRSKWTAVEIVCAFVPYIFGSPNACCTVPPPPVDVVPPYAKHFLRGFFPLLHEPEQQSQSQFTRFIDGGQPASRGVRRRGGRCWGDSGFGSSRILTGCICIAASVGGGDELGGSVRASVGSAVWLPHAPASTPPST